MPKDGDSAAGLNCEECLSGKNRIEIPVVCFNEKNNFAFLKKQNSGECYIEKSCVSKRK